jgi:hypothetical protein
MAQSDSNMGALKKLQAARATRIKADAGGLLPEMTPERIKRASRGTRCAGFRCTSSAMVPSHRITRQLLLPLKLDPICRCSRLPGERGLRNA